MLILTLNSWLEISKGCFSPRRDLRILALCERLLTKIAKNQILSPQNSYSFPPSKVLLTLQP